MRPAMLVPFALAGLLVARPAWASLPWTGEQAFDAEISAATAAVAPVWPLPFSLVKAVIKRESSFNPRARSPVGAIGLMQVMPFNAQHLGFSAFELWDPAKNILAGSRLLAVLLRHYRGDVISTLVAYNAGPRKPLAPVPNNGETPAYVQAVLRFYFHYLRDQQSSRTASADKASMPTSSSPPHWASGPLVSTK